MTDRALTVPLSLAKNQKHTVCSLHVKTAEGMHSCVSSRGHSLQISAYILSLMMLCLVAVLCR